MSPEDRYQEVNIPIEEDRLVDLLVYKKKKKKRPSQADQKRSNE